MAFIFPPADNVVAGTAIALAATDSLFLREGLTVGSNGGGGAAGVTATSNTNSVLLGNVISLSGIAFHATSFSNTVTVGDSGAVTGLAGMRFDGKENHVSNAGHIIGYSGFGLTIDGSDGRLLNSGSIQGATDALFLSFGGHVVVNSGSISSLGDFGINVNAALGDGANSIDNSGTIECAGGTAIFAGDAITIVTNSGHIHGDIEFGGADDTYDGSLGRIVGTVKGGLGDDDIATGAGRDVIVGGRGNDTVDGGAGRDILRYTVVKESGGSTLDTVVGFDFNKDRFDLSDTIVAIEATVNSGQLREGPDFTSDLHAAIGGGQMAAHNAVLFRPSSGEFAGHTILVCDINGVAGYQKNKDYVFDLADSANLSALDIGDFI